MSRTKRAEPAAALQLVGKSTRITIHAELSHHGHQAVNGDNDVPIKLKLLNNVGN
ncbi:MAG: hypothetical protein R2722_03215 [Tessaracoccus sp.]